MVILRSKGEWSPKQYSVSSDEEEGDYNENDVLDHNHHDFNDEEDE